MNYLCKLEEQVAVPTISIRAFSTVKDLPALFDRTYRALIQHLTELGEQPAGPPYAAYYNMDMENMDVETGFPVNHPMEGAGEIKPSHTPGGKLATCLHIGPYSELGSGYDALMQWIKENNLTAAGPAYEFYLNDPQFVAPDLLETLIAFPVVEESG
jgi:effector-binding domain-containing protein